jgi:hypothetical protein
MQRWWMMSITFFATNAGVKAGPSLVGGPLRCARVDPLRERRLLAFAGRELDLALFDLETGKQSFKAKNVSFAIVSMDARR